MTIQGPGKISGYGSGVSLSRDGAGVHLVRAIFLPAEETCLYLYRSSSADAVGAAPTRAGLRCERITAAISIAPSQTDARPPALNALPVSDQ